jgi:hypothetical protein
MDEEFDELARSRREGEMQAREFGGGLNAFIRKMNFETERMKKCMSVIQTKCHHSRYRRKR